MRVLFSTFFLRSSSSRCFCDTGNFHSVLKHHASTCITEQSKDQENVLAWNGVFPMLPQLFPQNCIMRL